MQAVRGKVKALSEGKELLEKEIGDELPKLYQEYLGLITSPPADDTPSLPPA